MRTSSLFAMASLAACLFTSRTLPVARKQPAAAFRVIARPWKKADRLFHRDPRWLGADAAYSIDLGGGRILWLFGDTFVGSTREHAAMIHNSIAIEQGSDPSTAAIRFYWRRPKGKPGAFFSASSPKKIWYWPGNGILIGKKLLLFLVRVRRSTRNALGFAVDGSAAILVENPGDAPPRWKWESVTLPPNGSGFVYGSGGLLLLNQKIYAYCPEASGRHDVHLVVWPEKNALRGNLAHPEFRGNEPVFHDGQIEFTITYVGRLKRYVEIQSMGFGAAPVIMREARRPEGPWSPPVVVDRIPAHTPGVFYYAAKAHPGLSGGDLIVTYATNTVNPKRLIELPDLYYPRFLRIRFQR